MKHLIALSAFTLFAVAAFAQNKTRSLEKIWETDTIIPVPESVLFDAKRNTLYVSLIDGQPWEADGKGGIGKMSVDGMTHDLQWIKGLNCPKGMAIDGNKLYVADLTKVVIVNIKKGTIEGSISPEGAVNLNDITFIPGGALYVSDSKTGTVYKIENEKASIYLEKQEGVNGLSNANGMLLVAAGKNFIRVNAKKEISTIAILPQGIDGVEPMGNGDYIVSSWPGYIYYVYADGKTQTLLDTHEQKKNTADIGFDPYQGMLFVPTFFGKTVVAYKVK
jgi:DNA-binding beta-propeller fold protein YncE